VSRRFNTASSLAFRGSRILPTSRAGSPGPARTIVYHKVPAGAGLAETSSAFYPARTRSWVRHRIRAFLEDSGLPSRKTVSAGLQGNRPDSSVFRPTLETMGAPQESRRIAHGQLGSWTGIIATHPRTKTPITAVRSRPFPGQDEANPPSIHLSTPIYRELHSERSWNSQTSSGKTKPTHALDFPKTNPTASTPRKTQPQLHPPPHKTNPIRASPTGEPPAPIPHYRGNWPSQTEFLMSNHVLKQTVLSAGQAAALRECRNPLAHSSVSNASTPRIHVGGA
jgi:hypothetical protein